MLIADKYSEMNMTPKHFSLDNNAFDRGNARNIAQMDDHQNWTELARE